MIGGEGGGVVIRLDKEKEEQDASQVNFPLLIWTP